MCHKRLSIVVKLVARISLVGSIRFRVKRPNVHNPVSNLCSDTLRLRWLSTVNEEGKSVGDIQFLRSVSHVKDVSPKLGARLLARGSDRDARL